MDSEPSNDNLVIESQSQDLVENSDNSVRCSSKVNRKKQQKVINITKPKSCKRGIVYLSYIPEGITVKNIRQILSKHGEIERIYLEKDSSLKKSQKRTKKIYRYTEGWIEFKKKSVAKMVANTLNGKQIGGKRHTKFHDALWNMKYLKRFKWSHLAEQMAYEKALRDQKLRLEIGRAKREATFYAEMIERSRHKRAIYNDNNRTYKQRVTDEQIRQQKPNPNELDEELLESIFK
ncbi:pre-rrna-processing protein esf2-like protein [Dermatophagoides farinae]|uniref:Activator of basal transcription 1 n=1 Tax=Dermatophagoides farinae TaxID=6954 RepID=A0A9D4NT83_DERFA|nr:pre-rRNA-processing protein esf2-like [Dermatophagoides farinae]KAH7637804.1 pre-rrna-processing protein esf2-like protein [Dermatophagoides farinae]